MINPEAISQKVTEIPVIKIGAAGQQHEQDNHYRIIDKPGHFRGALADEQIVFIACVGDDIFIHLVTGNSDGATDDNAAQSNHSNFGGSTANIHHHVSFRSFYIKTNDPVNDPIKINFYV